jgi:predicted nucleic acid-binding protein
VISAVDSSVILDVLADAPPFADASETVLRQASLEGKLIVCECVIAEVYPAINDVDAFNEFIADWQFEFVPSSSESAELAGRYFASYLKRGGRARRVLPDFLIASHALVHADRLLARGRDYFAALRILSPSVRT